MASPNTTTDLISTNSPGAPNPSPSGTLLISFTWVAPEAVEATFTNLALALPSQPVLIALPEGSASPSVLPDSIRLLHYTPAAVSSTLWVHTAADYLNTFKLLQDNGASACLLLGAEAHTLQPAAIRRLAEAVLADKADLATPNYHFGPHDGLVNSAILYPVTRALYGTRPRFPLSIDLGLSHRMAERLATSAQKFTAASQNEAILWPVSEAAAASYAIAEVDAGERALPQPVSTDLNSLLAQIAGSLFADIDLKAAFWQRARSAQPRTNTLPAAQSSPEPRPDVTPMIETFQLAYTNLHEIWSLVLPPNSLLGLKRLYEMPPAAFRMSDSLWARIVYDFILAFRLRTINRGHLLGALTPLYLAWVASHLILTAQGLSPEQHIQDLAATFETDKPYLVSRWRWPDRFNP